MSGRGKLPLKLPNFDTFKFSLIPPTLLGMKTLSHYIPTVSKNLLHLREFSSRSNPIGTILFIHGSIENGRIFYSKKGEGIAPYLASKGFQCFVLDLRARGKSTPSLHENFNFNQNEMLVEDFPVVFEFIRGFSGGPISLISHSWGGVLLNTFLLKFPKWIPQIRSMVHVSSKRRISVINLQRVFYIDLMWTALGSLLLYSKGYLPKDWYGPEGESRGTLKDTQKWVYSKDWIDPTDKENYRSLAKKEKLPPALYLTGKADKCLGHIRDVTAFARESGHNPEDILYLSKETGFKQDYDHINILTSKLALEDHFPKIYHFLTKHL